MPTNRHKRTDSSGHQANIRKTTFERTAGHFSYRYSRRFGKGSKKMQNQRYGKAIGSGMGNNAIKRIDRK